MSEPSLDIITHLLSDNASMTEQTNKDISFIQKQQIQLRYPFNS